MGESIKKFKRGTAEMDNKAPRHDTPTIRQIESERKRIEYKKRYSKTLKSTIGVLVVVAAAAVLLSTLFLPILQISGTSMEPTLNSGDLIALVKTNDFNTGDLIGFYYQGKILLKRVIGRPGDTVSIDKDGNVYVNEELIDEPYLTQKSLGDCDIEFPYQVPENRYFVLGDHRSTSIDSRSSVIGCIKKEQIVGLVLLKFWPLNEISIIK